MATASSLPYDAILVGGGPAGAVCAAGCADAGLRVLVLERARFPRPKVCGDCLNPDCWPTLERLGLRDGVRGLPQAGLRAVEFVSRRGRRVRLPLPAAGERAEITIKRGVLDAHLLAQAAARGAEVREETAVVGMRSAECGVRSDENGGRFFLELGSGETVAARCVVGADGRNSLVARLAGLVPGPAERKRPLHSALRTPHSAFPSRIGLQTHLPRECCPAEFARDGLVQMRWLPGGGYVGLAPEGDGELNISFSVAPDRIEASKAWARAEFGLPLDWPDWHTIAPLDRAPARPAASAEGVFLVGDAARVVEPFTGEGIYYALRSGELAAGAVTRAARGETAVAQAAREYSRAHRAMYRERGRLWVNRLARAAALHPGLAELALEIARWRPALLGFLTAKVVPLEGAAPSAP